ncbi:MAG: hypothetical protein LKG13_06880 [Atopobiaceae bacterium]|nr:hypothetical protein [Atopobiaceae bacterium]MCH4181038.1 hypothetical protein [Atopobiaceae bacterium]MCH4213757.1 hypothetical protein [Atopobiaceae bacterium]MCH4230544.1 hypothetical protein [Atopobiaceae bacterium]MCH4277043.1 hypothetical protein [Atopobiaceae bacterium]
MRHRRDIGRNTHGGFTMMELLGAVAVLAIMAAIVGPAFGQLTKSLHMTQLDGTAKSIYLSVQSRLTDLNTSGRLVDSSTSTVDSVSEQVAKTGQLETTVPADYPAGTTGDNTTDSPTIYYLLSTDQVMQDTLLGDDASGITNKLTGSWVVEVSPYTGEVYGVFYSEKTGLTWADCEALSCRGGTTDRSDAEIGYYHGGRMQYTTNGLGGPFKDLTVDVVNSEELYVHLTGFDATKVDTSQLSLELEITGENTAGGTTTWEKTYTGSDLQSSGAWSTNADELDIILDSMRTDSSGTKMSFANLYSGTGDGGTSTGNTGASILPGADITVHATITYQGNKVDRGSIKGINSLYGSRSYDSTLGSTIQISNLRHLNNLRKEALTTGGSVRWKDDASGNAFAHVIQSGDIDWDWDSYRTTNSAGADVQNAAVVSVQSRTATTAAGTTTYTAVNPLSAGFVDPVTQKAGIGYFTPITLTDGFNSTSNTSFYTQLDAANANKPYAISNLVIGTKSFADVGIFKTAQTSFTNVTITKATAYGSSHVATLVGNVPGGTTASFTKCSVSDSTINGADSSGGLVGLVNTGSTAPFTGCSITNTTIGGTTAVGGLLGNASQADATLTRCTIASSAITGKGNYVGGLVGWQRSSATDCSISNSTITATGGLVGGIAGQIQTGTVTGCSASDSSITSAGNFIGGIAGWAHSDLTDCTTTNVSITNQGGQSVGGVVGQIDEGASATLTNCSSTVTKTDDNGTYLYDDYAVTSTGINVGGLVGFLGHSNTAIDCTAGVDVSGSTWVGGLVGSTTGATYTRCSAHGTATTDAVDDATPTVEGNQGVGGLIGTIQYDGHITDCFAAENVANKNGSTSNEFYGGLVGRALYYQGGNTIFTNCYASGTVSGGAHVGGLIGWLYGYGSVSSCYATGDVYGASEVGGLIGRAQSPITDSISYGKVLAVDGTVSTANGGLVGTKSNAATISGCTYLTGKGYNDTLTAAGNPSGSSWATLTADAPITADDSHPYAASLKGQAFPFADTCGLGSHYGNWPSEPAGPLDSVSFSVVNGEELYASVSGIDTTKLDLTKLSITMTVSGENTSWGTTTWTHTWSGTDLGSDKISGIGTNECDLVLDSLRDGMSFSDLYQRNGSGSGASIAPGTDLTVKVTVTYDGDTRESSDMTCNSLFDNATNAGSSVAVSALRHLDNLRSGTSTMLWGYTNYSSVTQTGTIDWDWSSLDPSSVSVQSRVDGKAVNPLSGSYTDPSSGTTGKGYFDPITLESNLDSSSSNTFTAEAGTSIRNMPIGNPASPASYTGLFKTARIGFKGVTLVNPTVYGAYNTGALVGSADSRGGTIESCSVTGGSVNSSYTYVGGLVGYTSGSLLNCSATNLTVSGYGDVAGIAGRVTTSASTISGCSVSGLTVKGTSSYVGGVVGDSEVTLTGCSSTDVSTSGYTYVGGIAGRITSSADKVANCTVSGGSTTGLSYVGGLAGDAAKSPTDSSVTGMTVTGTSRSYAYAGGLVGKVESSGGNLTRCSVKGSTVTGSGYYTAGLIGYCSVELDTCSVADTSVSGTTYTGGMLGRIDGSAGSVATCTVTDTSTAATGDYVGGLAGEAERITFSDCSVGVTKTDSDGLYRYGSFPVTGMNYVGGLIGSASTLTIRNCSAGVDVSATKQRAGGLIGDSSSTTLTDCSAYGVATSSNIDDAAPVVTGSSHVGGLIGSAASYTSLTRCFSADDVMPYAGITTSTSFFGGLIGSASSGGATSCYASGSVQGYANVGGLIGSSSYFSVSSCYATGDTYGTSNTGGFVGALSNYTVSDSMSYGQVLDADGTVRATNGGFVGSKSSYASLSNCTYLAATGYNDTLTAANNPTSSTWAQLATGGISASNSHPYAASLKGSTFPFADTCGLGEHYGNWPRQVSWVRDDGKALASTVISPSTTLTASQARALFTTISGAASQNAADHLADYATTGTLGTTYHLFEGWGDATTDATGSLVYKATYAAVPASDVSGQNPMLSDTSLADRTVNGTKCTSFWQYVNNHCKDNSKKMDNDRYCDSEAPAKGGNANATLWLQQSLADRGYDPSAFSFSVYIAKNTYSTSDLYPDGPLFGTTPNSTSDNFLVICGAKLPTYPAAVTTPARVLVYDAATKHYAVGTVSVYIKESTYYYYNASSFSATTDWFTL